MSHIFVMSQACYILIWPNETTREYQNRKQKNLDSLCFPYAQKISSLQSLVVMQPENSYLVFYI